MLRPVADGQKARSAALDLLRGLAVVSMIQGHAFTALLDPSVLGSPAPRWYTLLHGLTAPLFLFGAGVALGIGGPRAPNLYEACRRPALLWAIGTAMQLPGGSLLRAASMPDGWERSLAVGPLQLVAACLIWTALLRALSVRPYVFVFTTALSTLLVVAGAHAVWTRQVSHSLPILLGTWFDGLRGSPFPLFPWAGFFGIGLLLAPAIRGPARLLRGGGFVALGAAVMMLVWLRHTSSPTATGGPIYWHAGVNYFLFRAGACALALGLLVVVDACCLRGRVPFVVAIVARHSLVAYVVHLVILYGSPVSRGLVHRYAQLSLQDTAALTLLLLLTSFAACCVARVIDRRTAGRRAPAWSPAGTLGS